MGDLSPTAVQLIHRLNLQPHPEGGYFRETYRSRDSVRLADGTHRSASTAIYFLLPEGTFSRWHRVASDEVWHHYEGDPIELFLIDPEFAHVKRERIGSIKSQCFPQLVVPARWWQAARPENDWSLAGCSVAPGFEFDDFSFLENTENVNRLHNLAPDLASLL